MDEDEQKTPDQPNGDSLEPDTQASVAPQDNNPTPEAPLQPADSGLEGPSDSVQGDTQASPVPSAPPSHPNGGFHKLLTHINIYMLLFILLIILSGAIIVVAIVINKNNNKPIVKTQTLTEDTLKQLASSDVTVGTPKQVLNVQSNAVFAGKVLINDSLEVAGGLQVGSNMTLPGITVSGISSLDQVQVNKNISVAGDGAVQGQLSIQKGLSVASGATFGGTLSAPQITANSLQLNGDLNITHHITAGGSTPGRSNGSALGNGGTTSLNGSDSGGSININTGNGAAAGCFTTVNFVQKYQATPHILITPVGSSAAGLAYYVNRTTSGFSVCTASTPPSNATFGFDYFVLD